MPPKINPMKVSPRTIRPASEKRPNSLMANSKDRFLTSGSIAVFGLLLFITFVIAQIIFIKWRTSLASISYIEDFNRDADGIFTLHQLRLHNPKDSSLVTRVKRDTLMLKRIDSARDSTLTVLDILSHTN